MKGNLLQYINSLKANLDNLLQNKENKEDTIANILYCLSKIIILTKKDK